MARQRSNIFVGAISLLTMLAGGCSTLVSVEVKPSDCVNPPAGGCTGAPNESRILDVRLYQLKQAVDPCQLDLDAFAQGKDLEVLGSALVETPRKEPLKWAFKVAANEPHPLGTWEIVRDTQYVLAVAIGRGRSRNSVRLIPTDRIRQGGQFPVLHFQGFDICLDQRCNDQAAEAQCRQ
jgi:hypothetical protein